MGVFEFTVLQRDLKEWHERPWTYVCVCYKESNKCRLDSYSVRNSMLIISHDITFQYCRVHIFLTNILLKECLKTLPVFYAENKS